MLSHNCNLSAFGSVDMEISALILMLVLVFIFGLLGCVYFTDFTRPLKLDLGRKLKQISTSLNGGSGMKVDLFFHHLPMKC